MKQGTVRIIALLGLALLLGGIYWWLLPRPAPPASPPALPAQVTAKVDAPASAPVAPSIRFPLGAEPAASGAASAPVSALGGVADLLIETLGRPAVLQFLSLDAFAHRLVATVDNLPRTHAPARLWPVHPAAGRFATQAVGETLLIEAGNSKRYAGFVAWVDGLDAKRLAPLYRRIYPELQRAYENLGYPERYFNDRAIDVIDHLLESPTPEGPLEVKAPNVKGPIQPVRPWVMIEFADPAFEARSAGQKLLLRIGNDNANRLKAKLRELRAALTQPR